MNTIRRVPGQKLFGFLIGIALLCAAGLTHAAEFSGKVIAVMDGDTLSVMRDNRPVKVRLAEIDAPEKAQPYGAESQKSLAEMVTGKQIRVTSRAIDDYGRMVAMVSIDELNVNHEQVRRGMAWEYSRFHSNRELMALQREAQQAKRGLWAGKEAIEPSQWRKQHPSTLPAPSAAAPSSAVVPDPAFRPNSGQACSKKRCSEMTSCEEAMHYLTKCGIKSLDGDADGTPCEQLCAASTQSKMP